MSSFRSPKNFPSRVQFTISSGTSYPHTYDVDRSLSMFKKANLSTYAIIDDKYKIVRFVNSLTPVDEFLTCEINNVKVLRLLNDAEEFWNCETTDDETPAFMQVEELSKLQAVNVLPFLIPHYDSIIDPQLEG